VSQLHEKESFLRGALRGLGNAVVAYSGGVDSSLLLYICHAELGDSCIAVTASSHSFPQRELQFSSLFCNTYGIRQIIIENDEFTIEGFAQNGLDRCYLCKSALFLKIRKLASDMKIDWIIEGSNLNDEDDYRPGSRAIAELGIASPLKDAGFTKQDINELSLALGLRTANRPSFSCLSTRIPFGEPITVEKLNRIDVAEQYLLDKGFSQVRVRSHGDLARIETDERGILALSDRALRQRIHDELISFGFRYVAVDLIGYRSGSMNPSKDEVARTQIS